MQLMSHVIKDNIAVIFVRGNITWATSQSIRDYAISLLKNYSVRGLLLNCEEVGCIDSAGVGALLIVYNKLEQRQAELGLYQVNSLVQELLKVIDPSGCFFKLYSTEESAIEGFNREIETRRIEANDWRRGMNGSRLLQPIY